MSTTISFNVPGKPVAKARARFTGAGHFYTPEATLIFENKVATFAAQAMQGRKLFEGSININLIFVYLRPKSHYRTGKYSKNLKNGCPENHTVKPDLDNTIKAIFDGCNRVVWVDDAQVCFLSARKIYGDREGVNVTIEAEE